MDTSLNITRIFGGAIRLTGRHWAPLFASSVFIFIVPTVLFVAVASTNVGVWAAIVAFSLMVNGTWWYQGLAARLVQATRAGEEPEIDREFVRESLRGFTVVTGVGLLASLGVLFGLVLLVVPGLILATRWAVAIPACVIERQTPWRALGRSRELVRGNGFEMFTVLAAVAAVSSTIGGWISIAYPLVAPPASLALANAYFELKEIREKSPGGVPIGVDPP